MMKAAGLPELTSFKDIQYLKVCNSTNAAGAAANDDDNNVDSVSCFPKGFFSIGQVRG